MAALTTVKLVISSEIRLVDLVHSASEKMAEVAGFDSDEALNVGLAVRETVVNAINHGNEADPSRKVNIFLETIENGMRARIRDQGHGFKAGEVPDPTDGEHLMQTSGRGLLLVRAFVDEIKFRFKKDRGMEVTLIKCIRPDKRRAHGKI